MTQHGKIRDVSNNHESIKSKLILNKRKRKRKKEAGEQLMTKDVI